MNRRHPGAWPTFVGSAVLTAVWWAATCSGADNPAGDVLRREAAVKTSRGTFEAAFTQASPYGTMAEVNRRFQSRLFNDADHYNITNEVFRVHVATNYLPSESWGVIVFIDPGGNGSIPETWVDVLDRHRLIWIAPKKAGNEREFLSRMRLALDAAYNMKRHFAVDAERIYVGGVSGGGRVASVTAPLYSDLFRGGFYMVGCDYFRSIPSLEQPNARYRAIFPPPPPQRLEKAKECGRYVLLTGETDGNRDQTLGTYRQGYLADGFRHVTYIEVPKMGHSSPDAAWFEKGLDALEATTHSPAAK